MSKKHLLTKNPVTLSFVANKYNDSLWSAFVAGCSVADIEFYFKPGSQFHLYTSMPNVIDEGYFATREQAESRANWRANLS